jgi:hypothetical protein
LEERLSGVKHDSGKLRWDLLPLEPIQEVVRILTSGAKKYGDNNWQQIENLQDRYYAALLRHLYQWRTGELYDSESGSLHLSHMLTNIIFLLWDVLVVQKISPIKEEAVVKTEILNQASYAGTIASISSLDDRGTARISETGDLYPFHITSYSGRPPKVGDPVRVILNDNRNLLEIKGPREGFRTGTIVDIDREVEVIRIEAPNSEDIYLNFDSYSEKEPKLGDLVEILIDNNYGILGVKKIR